jgi:hypothetical protein
VQVKDVVRKAIMMTNFRTLMCAAAVCIATAVPTDAQAQVTTQINYSFTVPIVKVLPNPCTLGAFTLVNGALTVSISAVQQIEFQLKTTLASSGTGKDVTSAGLPLIFGAGPDYQYSSDGTLTATFPEGIPAYFEGTMPMADFLVRDSDTLTGDSYMLRTVLRLRFNNGIPSAPTIDTISVACE